MSKGYKKEMDKLLKDAAEKGPQRISLSDLADSMLDVDETRGPSVDNPPPDSSKWPKQTKDVKGKKVVGKESKGGKSGKRSNESRKASAELSRESSVDASLPFAARKSVLKKPGESLLGSPSQTRHAAIVPEALEHKSVILKRKSQENEEGMALKHTQDGVQPLVEVKQGAKKRRKGSKSKSREEFSASLASVTEEQSNSVDFNVEEKEGMIQDVAGVPDVPVKRVPNDPVTGGSDVPGKRGSDVPGKRGSDVPAKRGSDVPGKRGSDVPAKRGSDVPVKRGSDVPAKRGSDVPVKRGSDVPAKRGSDVPVKGGSDVPMKRGPDVPAKRGSNVPGEDPVKGGSDVPVKRVSNVPAEQNPEVPVKRVSNVPAEQNPEVPVKRVSNVPAEQNSEVPVKRVSNVPAEPNPEVPVKRVSNVPAEQNPEVPAEQTQEIAVKNPVEILPEEIPGPADEALVLDNFPQPEDPPTDLVYTASQPFIPEVENETISKSLQTIHASKSIEKNPSKQTVEKSQQPINSTEKTPLSTKQGEGETGRVPSKTRLAPERSVILKKEPSGNFALDRSKGSSSKIGADKQSQPPGDKVEPDPEMFDMSTCETGETMHCCDVQDITKALQLSLPHCKVTETIILDNTPTIDLELEVDRLVAVARHHCNREKNAIRGRYEEELKKLKVEQEDELRRLKNMYEDEMGRLKGRLLEDELKAQDKSDAVEGLKQKLAEYEDEIARLKAALEGRSTKEELEALQSRIKQLEEELLELQALKDDHSEEARKALHEKLEKLHHLEAENEELRLELERLMKILDEHGLLKDQLMDHEGEIARLQELLKNAQLEHEANLDLAQSEILNKCETDRAELLNRLKELEGNENENKMLKEEIEKLRKLLEQIQTERDDIEKALREQIEMLLEELESRPRISYRHDGSIMVEQQEPLLEDFHKGSIRPISSTSSIRRQESLRPLPSHTSVIQKKSMRPLASPRPLVTHLQQGSTNNIQAPILPTGELEQYQPMEPQERPKRQSYYTKDQLSKIALPSASRCSLERCSRPALHLTNSIYTVTPIQQTMVSADRGFADNRIIHLEQKVEHLASYVDRLQSRRNDFNEYQQAPMRMNQSHMQSMQMLQASYPPGGGGYPGFAAASVTGMQRVEESTVGGGLPFTQYENTSQRTCPQNTTAVAERLGSLEATLEMFNKKYRPKLPSGGNLQSEEAQYNNMLGDIVREIKYLKECLGAAGGTPLGAFGQGNSSNNPQQNDFHVQMVYKADGKPGDR